ncbi:receptor kinase-like protein Xa21 [Miscanthus floridulus]|uniref:receptor kinase-like protein Xa21 n=1 Tax=Miscanthus floridulus TaxID=154761 RepID=UPI00345985E6
MSAESTAQLAMLILIASLLMLYGVDRTHCLEVPGNETDKLALLDFKKATFDPNGALRSWNTTTPYCQWNGVTCSLRHPGRVTVLDLSDHGLSGPISASLGNLTFLNKLKLSTNFFSGGLPPLNRLRRLQFLQLRNNLLQCTIPDAITNCSNLQGVDLSRNFIKGEIPSSLGLLPNLLAIQLSNNDLTGIIPSNLKNISQLLFLNLAVNQLTGSIPSELGQLSSMLELFLGANMLSGGIPGTLFNLSSLGTLDVAVNMLGGLELTSNIGDELPSLARLHMSQNMFEGHISPSLGNFSNLFDLDMSQNNFTGQIPSSFGNLRALTYLNLGGNNLQARDSQSWEFIDKLSHCRSLEVLDLHANNLQGDIPNTIGNLSTNLTQLIFDTNNLSGTIPRSIGNLSRLITLQLANNNLTGTIEEWCEKLKNLQKLSLETNNLIGPIPSSIGNLTQLLYLTLAENKFEGLIPPSLGSLPLLELNLSYNNLKGSIPKEIFHSGSTMVKCILSYNNLQGPIPLEIGNLQQVTDLQFSLNKLTGEIPNTLGRCVGLLVIQMDRNFLTGNISMSLGNLKSLSMLNLSHNNLSGFIPTDLGQLQHLTQLDLSYNNLQGEIPTTGVFGNASSLSFVGNQGLCGGVPHLHMPTCPTTTISRGRERKYYLIKILVPIFGLMSLTVLGYFFIAEVKDKGAHSTLLPPFGDKFLKVSYNDLAEATKNFSESNLIGRGSYGSVYRGNLMEDKLEVAVKVLDIDTRAAKKSFLSEYEALRSIRHRNIVPIITACSSVQTGGNTFKALVYGYMPNGNLDTWLHKKGDGEGPNNLSLAQRICIAVNIADALDYIHNDSGKPIIHCDVKPSNILLDDDMNARLGDFGIASFYHRSSTTTGRRHAYSSSSSGRVKGTIGYIAPEYAGGGRPSTCRDVYSFGVLLLEMLTGKRPTDPMFENGQSIISFVERSFPDQILQVIDASLQDECKPASTIVHQCLLSLVEVALSCTRQFPSERMTMREAANRISAIKASHVKGRDRTDSLQC